MSMWSIHSSIGYFALAICEVIILFSAGMAHSVVCSHNSADLHCAIEHYDLLSDENVNFAGGTHKK